MSEVRRFAPEATSRPRINHMEMLDLLNFSFVVSPKTTRAPQPERISQLDNLPFNLRVVGTAYYALELSNPMLKPLDTFDARLTTMRPGTEEAMAIIDDLLIATSVQAEIDRSYELYDRHRLECQPILDETGAYSPQTVGWLRAIQRMRNASDHRKRIGQQTGRASETVARLTIARQKGIKIPLPVADYPPRVE